MHIDEYWADIRQISWELIRLLQTHTRSRALVEPYARRAHVKRLHARDEGFIDFIVDWLLSRLGTTARLCNSYTELTYG